MSKPSHVTSFYRRFVVSAAAAAACAWAVGFAPLAVAQSKFPERPVTIVVPYAPGGAADAVARVLAAKLGPVLGASVVVDNKAGASGTIGEAHVAKAKADGYTLLYTATPYAINPHLFAKMPYGTDALEPLSLVLQIPNALIVAAHSPYTTVQDLVNTAKKEPGKVNYASGGAGSVQRLAVELLRQKLSLDMVHVGYKSGGPAITDVAAAQVDFMFATVTASQPLIQGGKLRALAVSSPERSPRLPDVPTVAETVVPNFSVFEWNGLMLPAGVPQDVRDKLHAALVQVMRDPEVQQRLSDMGAIAVGSTPAEFAQFIQKETTQWGELVRNLNLKVD